MAYPAAVKQPAAWFLFCPHCNGELKSPSGSLMFTAEDMGADARLLQCDDCSRLIRVPKVPR